MSNHILTSSREQVQNDLLKLATLVDLQSSSQLIFSVCNNQRHHNEY